jgi:hypothetical protein
VERIWRLTPGDLDVPKVNPKSVCACATFDAETAENVKWRLELILLEQAVFVFIRSQGSVTHTSTAAMKCRRPDDVVRAIFSSKVSNSDLLCSWQTWYKAAFALRPVAPKKAMIMTKAELLNVTGKDEKTPSQDGIPDSKMFFGFWAAV